MDVGIGYEDVNWVCLVQVRIRRSIFVYVIMNLRVSQNAGNVLTS
jgi:hypothetical protein